MGKSLSLKDIRTDGGTQPRSKINPDTVAAYADDLKDGAKFSPVDVFYDGKAYWLADGFHRVEAHVAAGLKEISVTVRQGTQRDAILFSVGANATHGLRRTNADKRQAVERLLNDEEWGKWNDKKIADQCGVSQRFVSSLRECASAHGSQMASSICSDSEPETRMRTVERGGKTYQMNTAGHKKEGQRRKSENAKASSNGHPEPAPAPRIAEIPAEIPTPEKDAAGRELPKKLTKAFETRELFEHLITLTTQLSTTANAIIAAPGGDWFAAEQQQVKADIKNLRETAKQTTPHAVCPYCGAEKAKCEACKGRGYVVKQTFLNAPEEMRRAS